MQQQNQSSTATPLPVLTAAGREAIAGLAQRHGVGTEAALVVLAALQQGGGQQAQFNHPELGGMGQWSRGGMLMIGDMFDNSLKAKVAELCQDAAAVLDRGGMFEKEAGRSPSATGGSGTRWPRELGDPGSSGSQNDMHYAVFPDTRRLAVDVAGKLTVYDIGDHRISGFSQQQGGDRSIGFTSQHGRVRLEDLPVVSGPGGESAHGESPPAVQASPAARPAGDHAPAASPSPVDPHGAIFAKIEGLAALHGKGILSPEEFEAKKAELLARL